MDIDWRRLGMLAGLSLASVVAWASPASTWQPEAPLTQVPLWPESHEIARPPVTGPETFKEESIENVTRPTMTSYPPKGVNTGTTVVVFPGGGYRVLAIEGEGTKICDWLTGKGMTCALLKYRVPTSGPQWDGSCQCRREPKVHMALQDAQRAIRLVRQQAATLHIDVNKIGVIGFSAGGRNAPVPKGRTWVWPPPSGFAYRGMAGAGGEVDAVDRHASS
ncbi:alpha/beta hydrolase [Pinirhizobacter sp.]|uniref:alpha/beta hydrolase n=1 Tax=Pinirhizobacter sp. TaxID=2950432 RepID=UPI0039C93FC5